MSLSSFAQNRGAYTQGKAWIKIDNKYGFVNEQNQLVIPNIYDSVHSFSEYSAAVKLKQNWFYIDTLGNPIHPYDTPESMDNDDFEPPNDIWHAKQAPFQRVFKRARPYKYGLAVISNFTEDSEVADEPGALRWKGYSFIGKRGYGFEDVTHHEPFDSIGEFQDGLIFVKDEEGEFVMTLGMHIIYGAEKILNFSNTHANIVSEGKTHDINPYWECLTHDSKTCRYKRPRSRDGSTIIMSQRPGYFDDIEKPKLDSYVDFIKRSPHMRFIVIGYGQTSYMTQQASWSNAEAVINYLVEEGGIERDRFIMHYGRDGRPQTVHIRRAREGEEGNSRLPPPHPIGGLRNQ